MTRLFSVDITISYVVAADDTAHAYSVASSNASAAARDDGLDCVDVGREIRRVEDLPDGWTDDCFAYGDDSKTIAQIIAELPVATARECDTKTTDMFTSEVAL
jgi:hypothetical protein